MAKRTHFIDSDFEIFFTNKDWEKALKSKVDYKTVTKVKTRRSNNNGTFFAGLVSHKLLSGFENSKLKENFEYIFNELDNKNYIYSNKDLALPINLHADLEKHSVEAVLFLFEKLKNKGINLQENKETIRNSFGNMYHPNLDKYKMENGLITKEDLKKMNSHYFWIISQFNEYKTSGVFGFVSKNEQRKEKEKYDNAIVFLKEIINSPNTPKEVIKEMLNQIDFDLELFAKFSRKNKLEISMFNEIAYFKSLELKPRDIFTSDNLELIELIEKKLGITYLDNTGRNPKEIFEEISEGSNQDFNSEIFLEYKDGTQLPLNKKVKYK